MQFSVQFRTFCEWYSERSVAGFPGEIDHTWHSFISGPGSRIDSTPPVTLVTVYRRICFLRLEMESEATDRRPVVHYYPRARTATFEYSGDSQ